MDIGTKIDALYSLRQARLDAEKQIKAMAAEEATIKQEIINELGDIQLTGAKGSVATASVTYKTKSKVTDWESVYAFIKDQDMPELLQKRITETLWDSLREDGVLVPGTEPFVVVDLSLTKSTRN